MAKTQVALNMPPERLSAGQPVYADSGLAGVRSLAQMVNWLYGYRGQGHLAVCLGRDGWDSTGEAPGALRASITTSEQTLIDTDLWIDGDEARKTWRFGAECVVGAGSDVVTVRFILTGGVGASTFSVTRNNAQNGTEGTTTGGLGSVTNGEEWVRLEVRAQVTTGTGTTHELLDVSAEVADATSSLPDPLND